MWGSHKENFSDELLDPYLLLFNVALVKGNLAAFLCERSIYRSVLKMWITQRIKNASFHHLDQSDI